MYRGLAIMFVLIGIGILFNSGSVSSGGFVWNWGWFGGIFGFVFFIWIFTCIFGWPWGWRHRHHGYERDEKDVLKIRYAKGEISKKQYEIMMKDLDRY